jgi:hypothetical protein
VTTAPLSPSPYLATSSELSPIAAQTTVGPDIVNAGAGSFLHVQFRNGELIISAAAVSASICDSISATFVVRSVCESTNCILVSRSAMRWSVLSASFCLSAAASACKSFAAIA